MSGWLDWPRRHGRIASLLLLAACSVLPVARAAEWLPVTPEELQMKSEPKAPKAPAIILYRQVDRNDDVAAEDVYLRIKVLTEEGRQYGNVELPYRKDRESIRAIEARTVRPDGTAIEFEGTIYDNPLLKSRDRKYAAKTFSLPSVEIGSILELRYRHSFRYGYVYDSRWVLSDALFTKHAKFSLRASDAYTLRWSWPLGLPVGTNPPTREGGLIRLEGRDIPAFVTEEHMPPGDVMKFRVEFIYEDQESSQTDFLKYWRAFGKRRNRTLRTFLSDRSDLERAALAVAPVTDTPEVRVRKLYAYAQSFRNLDFERAKSEAEVKREKITEIHDAGDILERRYGNGVEITWFFLALLRGAGFEADAVLVATRDQNFFDPRMMNAGEINSNAVVVKVDGREIYLDPGIPFTPFGLLPWTETAVTGLRLDDDGGKWVTTPNSKPGDSRIERKADLKLLPSGTLEGRVTVTYTGHEASERRLAERNEDDTDRREYLENDLKRDIPTGVEVKLTNAPDWTGTEAPLVAEFDLKVPGWAAAAGRRALLPAGLFSGSERHLFEHAGRVQPLYFEYPYQHVDEVTIALPAGWRVGSVPAPSVADIDLARYRQTAEDAQGSLRLRRELTMNMTLIAVKFYDAVRGFFQAVRAGDEGQIVVEREQASGR